MSNLTHQNTYARSGAEWDKAWDDTGHFWTDDLYIKFRRDGVAKSGMGGRPSWCLMGGSARMVGCEKVVARQNRPTSTRKHIFNGSTRKAYFSTDPLDNIWDHFGPIGPILGPFIYITFEMSDVVLVHYLAM